MNSIALLIQQTAHEITALYNEIFLTPVNTETSLILEEIEARIKTLEGDMEYFLYLETLEEFDTEY